MLVVILWWSVSGHYTPGLFARALGFNLSLDVAGSCVGSQACYSAFILMLRNLLFLRLRDFVFLGPCCFVATLGSMGSLVVPSVILRGLSFLFSWAWGGEYLALSVGSTILG